MLVKKTLLTLCLVFCLLGTAWCGDEQAAGARPPKPMAKETLPTTNSVHFVDVTRADDVLVKEPIVAGAAYVEAVAAQNTARMKAILSNPAIGEYCRIHFPAGAYYFNGAVAGGDASIFSTANYQSFTGDGITATRIVQKSLDVPATIKIHHNNCTIQNLSIVSTDYQQKYNRDWDEHPLKSAIALDVQPPGWHTDPQILNVNINATGNNITIDGFYRPFETGIRITGPWLNIYVQTMFILHVHNAIYINQGNLIAGPAKLIDVNAYAPAPTEEPHVWNVFFKSEGHFMEQVELIHCTYIGSQFISMDGTKLTPGDDNFTKPPTNPVYNMVVDHCYINSLWEKLPSEEPKWSGIYLNLPPKPGGIDTGFGSELYSKSIVFTYNCCAGKTPRDGAFFYIEGNLKDLLIHSNNIASGGGDRCIYIRATTPLIKSDVAVRDIAITDNIFNDFRSPITIGGNKHDPSRVDPAPGYQEPKEKAGAAAGRHDDQAWIEGVKITGNQTFYLPVLEKIQLTGFFFNRVRQVTVSANRFARTSGASVIMRECEDIILNGNNFAGLAENGEQGVSLLSCKNATLTGNIMRGFRQGIHLQGSQCVSLNGNNLYKCQTALEMQKQTGAAVTGNTIGEAKTSMRLGEVQDVAIVGNTVTKSGAKVVEGNNQNLSLQGNVGLDEPANK